MSLEPLLAAPFAVQFHVATVVPAGVLGAYLLASRKGTRLHRLIGRVWIALMVVTAVSTFFIHQMDVFAGFSPIHLLSAFVIMGSYQAIRAAQRGDIVKHRQIVTGIYFGGILIAGGFTLLPGRTMNQMVFGGEGSLAGSLAAVLLIVLPSLFWLLRPRTVNPSGRG